MTEEAPRIVVFVQHLDREPARQAMVVGMGLRLRDQLGGTLTALAVDWQQQQEAVTAALQAGCDRGVLVTLDEEHDAVDLDYLAVAKATSAALKRIGCEVFLCADSPRDWLQGAIGPAVAELQCIRHLTSVVDAALESPADGDADHPALIVKHRGGSKLHRFRCELPVALCITACEHPAPSTSQDTPDSPDGAIARLSLEELGVDLETLEQSTSGPVQSAHPEPKAAAIVDAADLIVRLCDDQLLR